MNTTSDVDFLLSGYDFDLPEEMIAQTPPPKRGGSRLLVLDRATGRCEPRRFEELAGVLPPEALLVVNNSRVLPARLYGTKASGGKVEFLPLTPLPLVEEQKTQTPDGWEAEVHCLLRASKSPRIGSTIDFGMGLRCLVEDKGEFGRHLVRLQWTGSLQDVFERLGRMPLPPYIRREAVAEDATRYQTTYARPDKTGSVAAPTAGLHFTPDLRQGLTERGFGWAEVTLYVGYGTFSPVRCENIREHRMHKEYVEVPRETAEAVQRARAEGRPVVAVGTTSARTLEGMVRECGEIREFKGETDIFIYPGYKFKVVDHMLTNFHLPKSSLVIMVSALAGRETILRAYERAKDEGFRFFSYGDAMFIR